ncbi:unnamed protein product [Spirodela intermedia]|uniref:Uncharacterized protein n=2 Tax=Spirodela intermedia TaxID=51605 RepID=A0A7I8LG12_SPIIN|nr:unnamed protein product [Spirodela intermedia]CAA6671831.1 unnamed protein product [Spirodela intermedia]CAA7408961.1 unnamed protein product [Spirodela intermedia]
MGQRAGRIKEERLLPARRKEERTTRPPRGYVPVLVGTDEGGKEHISLFGHHAVAALLEIAAQEFGYQAQGVLRIPCCADLFRRQVGVASGT